MKDLKINREGVKKAFLSYTAGYDSSDEKVRLKIAHTLRVASICDRIAGAIGLPEEEQDIAWLLGMLHDVGRFEQLRRFGTFLDAVSIDHAEYGADILCKEGKLRDYIGDTAEDARIEQAIRVHNKYRIPEGLDEGTLRLAKILRDADKIDIIRVNVETPFEEIYDISTEKLKKESVTPFVLEAFMEHHTISRDLMESTIDHLVGHIAFVYELEFPESIRIVKEQGYLERMMDFQSENPETQRVFAQIREEMKRFINNEKI